MFNKRLILSIIFFLMSMSMIIIMKPNSLFNAQDGSIKEFGVGLDKTIYSMGVVVVCLSIFSFYIFSIVDIIFR